MRFILGIVTGVVAGMLLAPDNGRKTRERLNNELPKFKKQANDALTKAKTAYSDLVTELGLTTQKESQQKNTKSTSRSTTNSGNRTTANASGNNSNS